MDTVKTTRKDKPVGPMSGSANLRDGVLAAIGNTPLWRLGSTLGSESGVELFAKWEGANPSGSLKDRVVYRIVTEALKSGALSPEATVVEASSGNTGIAMGLIGQLLGIRMRVYMPESKSLERRRLMRYLGVELVLTSGDDPNSHIKAAEALVAAEPEKFFYLNQNGCYGNTEAHALGTAAEIWTQTHGKVAAVIAALGTSGTLMGLAIGLRERNPDIEVIGVEPTQPKSKIEGLLHVSPEYVPPIYDRSLITETVYVADDLAIAEARSLARREGIFCGISSGATVAAARRLAPRWRGKQVVAVFGDRADRYLSTDLFADV
jgi:cysteine synthase B